MLNETKYKPLLLNYTQWENGQTGSVGMFGQNGATAENFRVLAADPWEKETVVWEARPEAASGTDGGWNASQVPIDPDYTYRFSTWVRRTVVGNGSFYLGLQENVDVLNRSNGASNGNPYFWVSGNPGTEWVLVVGHVFPRGSGTGSFHPDSGRYTVDGGYVGGISNDFVWAETVTQANHRSYLYYSTDVATRQQWVYPRMDKCDGTEPTIADLLAGHDSRNEDFVRSLNGTEKKPLAVQDKETKISNVSECSVTNGLVAWYPLQGDAKELVDRKDGVVIGAVPDARGYLFDATGEIIVCPPAPITIAQTISCWFKANSINTGGEDWLVSQYVGGNVGRTILSIQGVGRTVPNLRYFIGGAAIYSDGQIQANTWYHAVATRDSSGVMKLYLNGVQTGGTTTSTNPTPNVDLEIGNDISITARELEGNIADIRIYNRALSAEEIDILYNTTNPESETKMKLTEDCVYLQGQLKEV
jgi:hypothetical protein